MFALPLIAILSSCGKKAPDVGSSDVEELAGGMALKAVGHYMWSFDAKEYDYELRNIVKNNVDHEAQKTDFNFQLNLRKKGEKEWVENKTKFNAIAYYTEDGELYVELKR